MRRRPRDERGGEREGGGGERERGERERGEREREGGEREGGGGWKGRREGVFCTLEDIFTRIAFAPLQCNTTEIADMFEILDIFAVVVN